MYLALPDRVVHVSHKNRTFLRETPRFWHDRPWRRSVEGDALCSTGIRHQGGDFHHTGTETLLGIRTQRWSRPLGNGGEEDIWLAPELDCLMLKRESVRRNALRWPVFIDSKEATSIRWGEPDAKLFVIPPDYREVSDRASLWR
jgi:hypothetical protein